MSTHRLVSPSLIAPGLKTREQTIKDILDRGKIVRFTNSITGVTKDVNKWNVDEDGDLTAFRYTGRSPFLCWVTEQYLISELDE
jgi:hypothetical protein